MTSPTLGAAPYGLKMCVSCRYPLVEAADPRSCGVHNHDPQTAHAVTTLEISALGGELTQRMAGHQALRVGLPGVEKLDASALQLYIAVSRSEDVALTGLTDLDTQTLLLTLHSAHRRGNDNPCFLPADLVPRCHCRHVDIVGVAPTPESIHHTGTSGHL